MQRKEAVLQDLLLELFDPAELRRFVRLSYGGKLADTLPGISTSANRLAFELVSALARYGLVDETLFEYLRTARPARHADIDIVGRVWISEQPKCLPHSTASTSSHSSNDLFDDNAIRIFVSYSRKDTSSLGELEVHLRLLQRTGVVEVWHDGRIAAGNEWEDVLMAKLELADIIIFLLSPDLLASDFCWSIELARALDRAESGSAMIVPVIIRPCLWRRSPLARFQTLPRNATAISQQSNTDAAWLEVSESIGEAVGRLRRERGQDVEA